MAIISLLLAIFGLLFFGDFFTRFANITPTERVVKEAVATTIQDLMRITISPKAMVYQNKTLYLKESSVVKGEIFLHKKQILTALVKKLGADVKVWDISKDMRKAAGIKIGKENVYENLKYIPKNNFDVIICNLVLCINPESEVKRIVKRVHNLLKLKGTAFIGFCNPLIFDVPESRIDFRVQTENKYEKNHKYKKIKKEGNYEIIEDHRPIQWYEKVYAKSWLKLVKKHFTPEYMFKGRDVRDFVIFELTRC